ncbi:MAG: hypothetical protein ACR2KV_12670 [Solirubrobacteraceae bacterium]
MSTPESEPTEEELRAAWEEQLRHITVADVLIQTAVSLVNLAGRRLGLGPDSEEERDLAQVRDAIDAVRALMPVLERSDAPETLKPLRDAVAQLQLEYAKQAAATPGAAPPPPPERPQDEGPGTGPAPSESRLWVPGR